jgi:hypothetical protein
VNANEADWPRGSTPIKVGLTWEFHSRRQIMSPALVSADKDVVLVATLVVCFFCLVIFMVFLLDRVAQESASKFIDEWCAENKFKLVSKKLDRLSSLRGPFAFDFSRNRPVYAVTVEDGSGEVRKATIACGAKGLGVFSLRERIEVVWDRASSDKKEVPKPPGDELE